MREMLDRYKQEADRLAAYSRRLESELALETDMEKVNLLVIRKKLIDTERYEILLDIRSIQEYVQT